MLAENLDKIVCVTNRKLCEIPLERQLERLVNRGITAISTRERAGVSTGIGSHTDEKSLGDDQFEINDGRTLGEVCAAIRGRGLQPVMNDYVYVG